MADFSEINRSNSDRTKVDGNFSNGINKIRVVSASPFEVGDYAVFKDSNGMIQNLKITSISLADSKLVVDTSTWFSTGNADDETPIYANKYATDWSASVTFTDNAVASTTFTHRPTSNPGGGLWTSVAFIERTFS